MKLSKQMEEQSKKAKTQMEVKDVEIVLLNERIAMLVESNLYLDSQEEKIAVEVKAITPKTSPLVSSMMKRVKNRETRKEHKDLDFWYITKRQPKHNKTADEVELMVKESAKTSKEEQTQHQHPTKQIDTFYPVFHKLPNKSRMKLISLWATKTNSYPILQGKEIGSYLYLDDIDKIVKCEELSGSNKCIQGNLNDRRVIETKVQPQLASRNNIYIYYIMPSVKERYILFPIFNEKHWTLLVLDTKNGSWKLYNSMTPSTEADNHLNEAKKVRKVIEKYLQHHNPKLSEGNKFHEETEIAMNCPQQVDHSLLPHERICL
ncbi:unnamed protein product [Camellia sinensis]